MDQAHERDGAMADAIAAEGDLPVDAAVAERISDPLLAEIFRLATTLPREALVACRDLLEVLSACDHEELAEVRQMLTAVRQLPGTPAGAKAVLRGGADLVRALDRALLSRERDVRAAESA